MLKVKLPDGSIREYSRRVRPNEIAAEIGAGLAKATLAADVDGKVVGADTLLPAEGEVSLRLITKKDPVALSVMRHSCAHIMARAVMRLFDGVQLAFGPTIDSGFYYDFDLPHKLSEADFPAIEAEMAKIIKLNEPFERIEEPRDTAVAICRDLRQPLKVEHIEEGLAAHPSLSFYRQGEFIDLCRGPHVPSAGAMGVFKLLSVAGAYWKGDASRQQLQRLYATAFFTKAELDERSDHARRGQAPRSPCAGQAVAALYHQPAGRCGIDPVAAQGSHNPRDFGKLCPRGAQSARLSGGLHTQHRPRRVCTKFRAITRTTPTASSSRS